MVNWHWWNERQVGISLQKSEWKMLKPHLHGWSWDGEGQRTGTELESGEGILELADVRWGQCLLLSWLSSEFSRPPVWPINLGSQEKSSVGHVLRYGGPTTSGDWSIWMKYDRTSLLLARYSSKTFKQVHKGTYTKSFCFEALFSQELEHSLRLLEEQAGQPQWNSLDDILHIINKMTLKMETSTTRLLSQKHIVLNTKTLEEAKKKSPIDLFIRIKNTQKMCLTRTWKMHIDHCESNHWRDRGNERVEWSR